MSDKWSRRRKAMLPAAELLALVEAGTSFVELAQRFDCTPATVRHRIRSAGLQLPTSRPRRPAARSVELRLLPVVQDASWRDAALCAQTDPEAFYPEKGGSTREAKKVCSACPVRDECLQWALAHDERFGIWGGLSERERRKVKRPRVCALAGCDQPVPVSGDGVSDRARRYCSPAHGRASRAAAAAPPMRRDLPCSDCGRRFSRPCDLARHAKAAHPSEAA